MTSARAWIGVGLAWLAALSLAFLWLARTPAAALREQLRAVQFWSLEVSVIAVIVCGAAVAREIRGSFDARDARRILALGLLALSLTVFVAPRTNRIFYDEQIYQSIGQNLTDLKLAQMCNDGTVEYGRLRCSIGEYNKQPYAYPHLLSLAYRVFGVHETIAFIVNAAVMTLAVAAVYLLVSILSGDRVAGFFAGLLLALTPQQILWSATAAVEPSASLASVVALLCAAQFCRSRSSAALAATAVTTGYAFQFRQESLLIAPVIAWLLIGRVPGEFRRPRLWWAALLFFAIVAVHIGHTFAVRSEGWGTTEARFGWQYVRSNLAANGAFFTGDERFPVIYSLLAVMGLFGRKLVERGALALYFVLFFGIDLVFYAGSYNYGADVRYSLMTYPAVAGLGGLGAAQLTRWIARARPGLAAQTAVTAALAFQFLWYAPVVRATTEEAWAARADVQFAKSVVPQLQGNSYVLTHNPGMFQVWGVSAGQMSLAVSNPAYLEILATRYAGGVYLHWNFWCNVQDPLQREFCHKAVQLKPLEPVAEHRERDELLALYRVKTGSKD